MLMYRPARPGERLGPLCGYHCGLIEQAPGQRIIGHCSCPDCKRFGTRGG